MIMRHSTLEQKGIRCVWLARVHTRTSLLFQRHAFVRHERERLALSKEETNGGQKGTVYQVHGTAVNLLAY